MKLRSNSTNSTGVKRGLLIDAFDERLSNTKSLKTNQGDVKRISHFYDKDIEIDVECHYEDFNEENVKVEPDVHIKSEKEFEATLKRVKVEDGVYVKNEKITEFKNFKVEPDLHIKSEKEFEVNPKSNFRTLRNRNVNLAEQAPLKNVNIKKETIIEENIQNNSGDIQRASHNDDREIAELIESHDVRHKLKNVKEEPKVRIVTEKRINTACTLLQQAAQKLHNVEFEEKEHVVKKKVIEDGALRTRNKKKVKKNFQSHRECCQSYQSFLNST